MFAIHAKPRLSCVLVLLPRVKNTGGELRLGETIEVNFLQVKVSVMTKTGASMGMSEC